MRIWAIVLGLLALSCASPQQQPQSPTPDTPKAGGRMTLRVSVDPIDYDPSFNGRTTPMEVGLAQAYHSLTAFKTGPDVGYAEMVVVPKLAERWDVSPDGKNFTFHLRKGVKFANLPPLNGRELTSADVKWTFEYYNRTGEVAEKKFPPALHVGLMFEGMTAVETPDPYTAVVRFQEPFLPFLAYNASEANPIVPREIYLQDGHLKDRIVGTGAYQLNPEESQKSTRYVFKRNAAAFDAGKTFADEIRWLVLKEDATAFAAFQTKQVDILHGGLAFPAYQQVKASSPGATFQRYLQPQGYHLHPSQARGGPLTDVRVRRALSMSIDRDEINKISAGGEADWALPGAIEGLFTGAEARQLTKQDVNEARRLLTEAGYPNGVKLEWPVEDNLSQDVLTWAQLIQAQVKRAGFDIAFNPMDKNDQRAKRRRGDFDIDHISGTGLLEADADSMMFGVYHRKGSTNWPKVGDPELDKLLEAQRREANPEKRREAMRAAVRHIVDQAWGIELIYPPKWNASQSYVKGYYPHFSVEGTHMVAWLDK